MPGAIPGPVGFVAFAAVKFGGYVLAGVALRKAKPPITAGPVKVAAVRTSLGIVIGPLLTLGAVAIAVDHFLYPLVVVMRFFIWMLVIFLFTKHLNWSGSKLALYSLCGALWSCALDVPAILLAFVAPGKISIC